MKRLSRVAASTKTRYVRKYEMEKQVDTIIIGSGVAGLSAALYAARYELSTIVIGDMLGGATASAWIIENYPGYESIDGYDLVVKMRDQVEKIGVEIVADRVTDIKKSGSTLEITTETGKTFNTKTVIFTMGAARKKLGLAREDELALGKGIHYCTTCDGPLYKGKTIGIVGAGDAAVKGMSLAVQYADKIYSFVRGDQFKAEPVNYERIKEHIDSGKIEVRFHEEVAEFLGTERLSGVRLKSGKEVTLDGLFIEIGATPEVELAVKMGVELDNYGYISVNNMMETNVEGIYAAGDTTNFFGHFKQVITASAMGSVAATSAFKHATGNIAQVEGN
jgi:thioredoxin reductase (NADPH)